MNLFRFGEFALSGGTRSNFKIDCDALSDEDIGTLAYLTILLAPAFGAVEGVPRGGLRLAEALHEHVQPGNSHLLIVDDVLTSGGSIERQRAGRPAYGVVIFARDRCPEWVCPIFQMTGGKP